MKTSSSPDLPRAIFLRYVAFGFVALVASHWLAAATLKLLEPFCRSSDQARPWILASSSLLVFVIAFWSLRRRHHQHVRGLDIKLAFWGLLVLLGGQWFALSAERCLDQLFHETWHLPHPVAWLALLAVVLYVTFALLHLRLQAQVQRLRDRRPESQRVFAR